jgi:membrane dipeptidase
MLHDPKTASVRAPSLSAKRIGGIMYKKLLLLLITLGFAACSTPVEEPAAQPTEEDVVATARRIHDDILTIDTHVDIPLNYATEEVDPGVRGDQKVDLPKMREGGLNAVFFVVYTGQTARTPENYAKAQEEARIKFEAIHRMADEMYPDQIELAYTPDDVERIHASGKLVALIGIENGYAIGKDSSLLEKYYEQGARYMTLTHGGHNDIADSGSPRAELGDAETEHNGVSEFGKDVIHEMNRLGMLVDVSHVSKKSMLDAAELSRAPIILSHSSVRALSDVSRNVDDEQLLALKENGGVIHICALDSFIKSPPAKVQAQDALLEEFGISGRRDIQTLPEDKRAEFTARMAELDEKWPPANLQDYVNHIDYATKLIGVDHVGIGTDFDGGGGIEGFNNASEAFNVTLELVRRGYTEEDIAKIWGGNLLRVWREADRVAAEMQAEAGTTE